MSLHVAAQHLATKGRNGDTELVHMTKGELKGLQALAMAHGGSLSVNPDTGLAEASFLKNLLPMIAGIGLNMMFPGSGAMIGLGVGGLEAARTGDLGKGLMAGLGAYGGANLAAGLASTGATAGGMASGAEALGTTPQALGTTEGMTSALSSPSAYEGADIMTSHVMDPTKVQNFADAYTRGAAPADTFMGQANQMGAGIKQAFQPGGGTALYNALPDNTLPAVGASLLNAATPEFKPPSATGTELDEKYKNSPYAYNLDPNFRGYTPARPSPYYRPTGLGYALGGTIEMYNGGAPEGAVGQMDDEPRGDDIKMASGGMTALKIGEGIARDTDDDTASLGAYDAAKKRLEKQYAAASLKPTEMPKTGIAKLGQIKPMAEGGLGGYSDGGRMLKGPGDGMSDDIPAVIGKKQPARLADGEFVVPADVVSHLGNGSTDAGAKKLYGMMDKVRQARTGKKKQAPAVKADKYMPA